MRGAFRTSGAPRGRWDPGARFCGLPAVPAIRGSGASGEGLARHRCGKAPGPSGGPGSLAALARSRKRRADRRQAATGHRSREDAIATFDSSAATDRGADFSYEKSHAPPAAAERPA